MVVGSLRRIGLAFAGAALLAAALGAEDPSPTPTVPGKKPPAAEPAETPKRPGPGTAAMAPPKDEAAPPARGLDRLPVSRNTVLVICKEVKEALQLLPEGVFLTPERYKELLDRIDQLERQAKAPRPEVPSACKLTGQVDGELVRFQAQFEFRTDRPRTLVALGCQRSWLKPGATLDGQLPLLLVGDDGQILVQVEAAGVHQASLELELPLATRGAKGVEQGFDLGLPRAAITTLEKLTLPPGVAEVRVNGRTLRTRPGDGPAGKLEGVPLGPVERLDLTWKGPSAAPQKGPPLLEVRGQVGVRVTDTTVISEVELTLQVLRGETREWRVQVPPQMVPEVKEPRPSDERVEAIDLPDAKSPVLKIRLKEPGAEPLKVAFQVRQPRSRAPVPVGLFPVANARRQRGTIAVSAPADLRLRFFPRGDVLQRDVAEEARRDGVVAEFSYGNLPTSASPAQPAQPPLEILAEEVKGVVEARVEHSLTFTDQGWRAAAKFLITPVRTKVGQLEIELPPAFELDQTVGVMPAELVDAVEVSAGVGRGRTAVVRLVKEQSQPFAVTLPGLYPAAPGGRTESLELPRPLKALDRGGQVTATVPEGKELVHPETGSEGPAAGERQHTWRSERFPNRVEVGWRAHRTELAVSAVADITVVGRQVQVRHRFNLPSGSAARNQITLAIPDPLAERVRVTAGGTLGAGGAVTLALGGKDVALTVEYSFAPGAGPAAAPPKAAERRFDVPLVRVAEATRTDTKVRVWTDPGVLAALAVGPWEEQAAEVVAERKAALPALVLRGEGADVPLALTLHEPASGPLAAAVIEQATIRATVEGAAQSYRTSFRVRLNARELDVEFPGPLALLSPYLLLDGKKITRVQALEPNRPEGEGGTVLRLHVDPESYPEPALLEIWYKLPAGPAKSGGVWATAFSPPALRGALLLSPVAWQVELPAGWVPLYQGGGVSPGQRWAWRGGLLAPGPAFPPAAGDDFRPSLVSLQPSLRPLDTVQVPNQLWLFACSALLLAVGLGLSFAPWSRVFLVVVLLLLGVGGGLAAVWRPGALPAVLYGCEPGLAVLLLVWAVQWALHRRYRRQVVFMPGFTRLKTGSSLIRRDGNNRPREPSTVDGPTQRDSSFKQPSEGAQP